MASNSILKLQVDDKQYEASLKSAQQGLQALMNALRNSGKSFSDLDKNTEQYVRALGNMDATAKNTRGRIGEMSSAFVELSQVEKQLTDQERQSPVGKALTESLNQLKQRTIEAKQELADLDKQLTSQKVPATTGGMFSGIGSKMEGALAVFGGNLMTKAAGAVAQLGSEMADMVKQGIELARQGEGIRIAFERLGRGDILDGLREATHGTVTDLELMKAAVMFNDFKLPVEELGTMLAFAQQKAKDTGQSVDYMVSSIVTGLGRKSLMILDNLGLSAAEIKDKMKDTGDMTKAVGAIIREQMAKAGDYVETAADRAAQANVSLQNKMEELGRKFAPVEEASNQLWTSMKIGILDVIGGPLARLLNGLTEAGRLKNMLNDLNGEDGSGNTKVGDQLKKLQVIKKAGGSDYIFNSTLSGMMEDYNRQIMALDAQIKNGGKKPGAGPGESQDVRYLQRKMKALGVMRDQLAAGAKDITKPKTAPTIPSTGGTGSKGGKTITEEKDDFVEINGLINMATERVNDLQKRIREAPTENIITELRDQLKDAQAELDRLTGKVKSDGAPTFTMAQLEGMSFDNQMPTNRGNNGRAQDKLDLATAAFATGGISNIDFSTYISGIKNALSNANLGSELYNNMTEKLKDATTVSTILQEMMERGLAGADLESTAQALKEKLLSPEGIDQTAIQSFLDELNKQIEEAGGVGLKLNADTGEVTDDKGNGKNDGEELKKFNDGIGKLSGGLSQVTGGLKAVGVEIPKEVDQVLGVINGVSKIISGVGTIISIFSTSAITANTIALGALTSAVWASVVSNAIPFFSGGGVVPAFAQGGTIPKFADGGLIGRAAGGLMIPGNSMSGDRLRLPVDGGRGMIGVNSGELILNRAQQGNLASQLEGGVAAGANTQPFINGEMIYLGLQAYMRRSGLDEIVTAER